MRELTQTWWVYLVRGACAILFGLLAIVWPDITLYALVVVFGAFAIVNGVFSLFNAGRGGSRGWMIVSGIVGILTGLVVFLWPGITALVLLFFIAGWAIATGLLEIVAAIRLRKVMEGEWTFIVSGVLSVLFGILLLAWPGAGALAVVWLIGTMAIVYGIALLALAFRLRGLGLPRTGAGPTPHAA
ncbi:HdeD family acid-resistance protein [Streptosporangium fragile]|uniref:HdeD family acid-resistance protein n=1 Tax=Streptosporangium fragile TaxID=46186 RepID=A0ABP6IJJ1_9ACTN